MGSRCKWFKTRIQTALSLKRNT